MAKERKDWVKIIDQFLKSKNKTRTIECGSPGSAQVTRARLIKQYDLVIKTKGPKLILSKV